MDKLTEAVLAAIAKAPCSLRALARAAGVPQSTLVRIRSGERSATREVASAVARGLREWADQCDEAASDLEVALEQEDGQ